MTLTAFIGGVRNPDLANADQPTITARVHDDLRAAARRQGRADVPRVPSLAQGHPAVRSHLRPLQGHHGRGGAAESGVRARGILSRGRGVGEAIASGEEAAARVAALPAARADAGERAAPRRHAGRARSRSGRRSTCGRGSTPPGYETERVEVRTTGDMVQDVPLSQIGEPRPLHPTDRRRDARGADRSRRALAQGSAHRRCRTGSRWWPWASGRIRVTRWWAAGRSMGRPAPGRGARDQQPPPAGAAPSPPARPPGPRYPRQRGHPARQARREPRSGPPSCSPRRDSCGSASATASASGCRPS